MRRTIFSILLMFLILSAVMPFSAAADRDEPGGAIAEEWPELDFTAAYDYFGKGDFAASAGEIRKAADSLHQTAERSSGNVEDDLLWSYDELKDLADDVEKGAVKSPASLRRAFYQAHRTLAEYYSDRLEKAWFRNDFGTAGRALRAALENIQRGISWADDEIREQAEKKIRELRELGERLAKEAESLAEQLEKMIREFQKELRKLEKGFSQEPEKI